MNLLLVGKVEPFVVVRNWNRVEKTLKIGIPVERVEKIFKGQRNICRKGIESIDQQANVGVAATNRGETFSEKLSPRNHLAGGRLKATKPGIRPVNFPDVWRRLAAKGLLTHCLPELSDFFQKEHPRVFQFATACPNGAAKIFHLINSIAITC